MSSNEDADYASECQYEADMVTVQSDNQFLRDLHHYRAELAAMETLIGADTICHHE